jgi:transcriptional regulator with XRE-family HTH domain
MLTDMALVFRVREFREVKGWTQAELARRCALRPATLSAIETNSTTGIDLATLEAIADALDVEPGFLIAREPRTKKPASRRR